MSNQRITLENYLTSYFKQNQGVRLGETTVLSHKVHGNDPKKPGEIRIYTDQDAGKNYMNQLEENLVLHMDVFHECACLNPIYVARHIKQGIENFFIKLQDENRSEYSKEKVAELIKKISQSILLKTSGGEGTVFSLTRHEITVVPLKARIPVAHVHLLFVVAPKYYDSVVFIADAVEQAVLSQGFEIRRVEKITHQKKNIKAGSDFGNGINLPGFNSPEALAHRTEQNRLQIIMNLANDFGSVDDAVRFLESLTATRNLFLGAFAEKHNDGDLKQTFLEMSNLNLVKKITLGYVLTDKGKELRDFIRAHQKELESQVRKTIRRYQIVRHNYRTYRNSQLKSRKNQITNHKKISDWNEKAWLTDVAIPETIVNAAARSFHDGQSRMTIKKQDIKLYGSKSFAPIDTVISIDCSGSMIGEKIKAVSYLAQHFLLTAKEKVSVVAFQEMTARVVVPFTKNFQKLDEGLRTIRPEGLTPLAKGIVESIDLIKRERARNPLMILITDGIPSFPLWTNNAQQDSLTAAEMIAENKIRLVCIGVVPNEAFVRKLAEAGHGNLYIVDELDKNSLLDVVTREWDDYKHTK